MRILIAGGGGYVGRAIIEKFACKHEFINLSLSRSSALASNNVLVDLARPLDFLKFDKPIDLIINCVECHPDSYETDEKMKRAYLAAVRHLIDYARRNSIERLIHFSVNHIHTVENDYQQTKFVAEGLVKSSGLKYIVFKPTIIFGENSPLDYLIGEVVKRSFLLKFWSEEAQIAPVHIVDVLANINCALENDECWQETYALRGPEAMSFDNLIFRRAKIKRPVAFATPLGFGFARRSMMKNSQTPPRHLRLLLDWVNADDTLCPNRALLAPQVRYQA